MDRREFVKGTLLIAGMGAVGYLPRSAAPSKRSGLDADAGPAAVEPIKDYLKGFQPVAEGPADLDDYALSYDVVHWRGNRRGRTKNAVIGSVAIRRSLDDGHARYRVEQKIGFGGVQNILEARITCATDELNTLQTWRLHAFTRDREGRRLPVSEIEESGRNDDGEIHVRGQNYRHHLQAARPLVSQWSLLHHFLAGAAGQEALEFDLLHDASIFKPRQELISDGPLEIPLKAGRRRFRSYVQLGEGVLPIHYVVDDGNRPQLVTASMLSWALTGIR